MFSALASSAHLGKKKHPSSLKSAVKLVLNFF